MKTFAKLLPSLIIPLIIIFSIIIKYNPIDRDHIDISKITPKKIKKDVDHTKFEILQQEFATPQDMTKACLTCHNRRGGEFQKTAHWTWTSADTLENGMVKQIGKRNVINNFCGGINTNELLCSGCHAGYGYKDKDFDFRNKNNIDCIICHDNSGKYRKKPGTAGMPHPDVDLAHVAQNVGPTTNKNCVTCHAKGGGGNNVKHGDMDLALADTAVCTVDIDVHMSKDGANLTCSQCHSEDNHKFKGSGPLTNANELMSSKNRAHCTDCHTTKPHNSSMLNSHYEKVACETCHIPLYAKVEKTKTWWDWSTAAILKDGEPIDVWSEDGMERTDSKHGTQRYGKNLKPEYRWWNGIADKTTVETKIDPTDTVDINALHGGYSDVNSKIYPFKIMRGKQPYDTKNNTLVQFNTWGKKGSGALWKDFDWQESIRNGMDYVGQPYSGNMDFVATRSYWPLNHMVSQSKDALSCTECHSSDGRLADLDGFYLPGRDINVWLDWAGKIFILFSVIGIFVHGTLRVLAKKKDYK